LEATINVATLDDRLYALIARLTELTDEGKLPWSKTTRESAFSAELPSGSVIVSSVKGGRMGGYPYEVVLFGSDGEVVEEIRTLGPQEPVGPWDAPIRNLYIAARAAALDVQGAVNNMLLSLGVNPDGVPARPAPDEDDIPF
jgi:hypothetical protein